jgi:Predicted pyridoxal phosphate-dependent enzyme apparently involved in regulation of cell wall biogenesis
MNNLAINGGKPVREKEFPTKLLGASLIGSEEMKELADVVKEKSPFRHYGLGNPHKTEDFESEARKMLGAKYALAVSSGSAALICAVNALGIGPGDEVIIPGFGWFSDYNCIVGTGALPVFADIDDSMTISPVDFERKITSKTKAVIVVHYQGGQADMDKIMSIAKAKDIKVIEDCAQAFGGTYKGQCLGTIGDIGISSFQANKIITCGEGGILYTSNEEYFTRAVRYHDLGYVRPVFEKQLGNKDASKDEYSFAGNQYRMSDLQGAFILAQLRKLPGMLEKCRNYHDLIKNRFKSSKNFTFRPEHEGNCGITLFLKFKTSEEATNFSESLKCEGIPIGPSSGCCNIVDEYPIMTRKVANENLPPFGEGYDGRNVEYSSKKDCPNTNEITSCYFAIGVGPQYSDEEVNDIITAIEKVENTLYSK